MTLTPSPRSVLAFVLGSIALAGAQEIQLNGVVLDAKNNPLPGITVSLDGSGLIDLTDASGRWRLVAQTSGLSSRSPSPSLRWNGRRISLELPSASSVSFDAYDARGARIGGQPTTLLQAGVHDLGLGPNRSARGVKWVRVVIDGKSRILTPSLDVRTGNHTGPVSANRALSDSTGLLVYSYAGETICSKPLDSLQVSGIVQAMREFHVRAKVIPDTALFPSAVKVHLDRGGSVGIRQASLSYLWRDSACIGRFFEALPSDSARHSLRAWINALASGGRRIGISDTTTFTDDADTLRFDHPFQIGNAFPKGFISGDSVRVVNTDYRVGFVLDHPILAIRKFEWDIGDGNGFQVGDSVKAMRWREGIRTTVRSRLTDEDGSQTVFCKPIQVVAADSIDQLQDRTAVAGKGIVVSLDVFDKDGIQMTIFDFGDGTKDTTRSAPYANSYHEYAVLPSDAGEPTHVYTLTATVIDGLGNAITRTAKVTVSNPRSAIVVMNTVGEAGTPLTLHASLLDTETIAKVEWSVAGSVFRQGRADTTIILPDHPTDSFLVRVRVANTKGYQYAIATIPVRALKATRITDARDGRQYRIVTIGTQTWMAQNLAYRQTIGKPDTVGVCDERDTADCSMYGRRYTWAQAMGLDSSYDTKLWPGASALRRGICPEGWHVPAMHEWTKLVESAGGVQVGGGKLKATWGWNDDCKCGIGTDNFWFSAYPSTRYRVDGRILDIGEGAYWWTTDQEHDAKFGDWAYDYRTFYMDPIITGSASEKRNLESLRCIKD